MVKRQYAKCDLCQIENLYNIDLKFHKLTIDEIEDIDICDMCFINYEFDKLKKNLELRLEEKNEYY